MPDQLDNIMLVFLRRLDEKMDRIGHDLPHLKVRMTAVEEGLAGVNRRLDRMDMRMERVERRLDLIDAPS